MTPQTPMLKQYFAAKAEHPGVLMAMRVGDFYEFYGPDAEEAARLLEITLTGKEDGENGRVPMAGVPFHSVERYLARLLQAGRKVALCDQLEDPKAAKGLVRRGVTRVLTPGTLVEDAMLEAGRNQFLAALCVQDDRVGLAVLDPSTGEFAVTEVPSERAQEALLQELARLRPAELLIGPHGEGIADVARQGLGTAITPLDPLPQERAARRLREGLGVGSLAGFGCEDKPSAIVAASMVLQYAERNRLDLAHVEGLTTYSVDGFMRLDPATRRSLELTQNLADGGKRHTLLSILDLTQTSMGARLLRGWIESPLLNAEEIRDRLGAVRRFTEHPLVRGEVRDQLRRLADVPRLVGRCATGYAGPRDLGALRDSLLVLPELAEPLARVGVGRVQALREQMVDHRDLALSLVRSIVAEPPAHLRDGGVVAEGFDPELDKLRELGRSGRAYIAALESEERAKTGIPNLKVGYNSVFGYYLEVPKAQMAKVPEHYVRKQTTAAGERYITAELKEHESLVLGAQDKATALESDLFHRERLRVAEHARALLQTARALAELDVLATLAEVAVTRRYVEPEIVEAEELEVAAGRHPVVEAASSAFVPNDLRMGGDGPTLMVLTGPNMAGKSTFLRQTALIQLLAQIGSFVPADRARLSPADRIFARIGAKDELALGQSTFMVEMVESAHILHHATARSLVILDEVGRGTSTYDGLAIAWAMVERLAEIGAKTLFATHYHQLNALEGGLPGVANYRVAVEEVGEDLVWTHRVLPGGTDRSYGVHVARLAGVPPTVLRRAEAILHDLEGRECDPTPVRDGRLQLTLFEFEDPPVVRALRETDVNALTPMQALTLLERWQRELR